MTFIGTTDKELVEELRRRGYRVAKADFIRTASVEAERTVDELVAGRASSAYMEALHRSLGAQLGMFLMHSGAIPVAEEVGPRQMRRFRATATIVVQDPQFDWPYELKMNR